MFLVLYANHISPYTDSLATNSRRVLEPIPKQCVRVPAQRFHSVKAARRSLQRRPYLVVLHGSRGSRLRSLFRRQRIRRTLGGASAGAVSFDILCVGVAIYLIRAIWAPHRPPPLCGSPELSLSDKHGRGRKRTFCRGCCTYPVAPRKCGASRNAIVQPPALSSFLSRGIRPFFLLHGRLIGRPLLPEGEG